MGPPGPTGPPGTSDARLKNIEGPIGNTLSKINAIRGVVWNPNELGQSIGLGTAPRFGLIADEVEAQFPELTFQIPDLAPEDNFRGIDYSKVSAVLVEAIKELDQKLTDIENQLGS